MNVDRLRKKKRRQFSIVDRVFRSNSIVFVDVERTRVEFVRRTRSDENFDFGRISLRHFSTIDEQNKRLIDLRESVEFFFFFLTLKQLLNRETIETPRRRNRTKVSFSFHGRDVALRRISKQNRTDLSIKIISLSFFYDYLILKKR